MGINLPARLVIIKSTKCYKGSGKGYQEYSQIELDQMMGRAGRIPFDKEGTVVIMTEKGNYSKYVGEIKLENL
jgi:ATP-dependent DNA helicase HFM1/MER3